MFGSHAAVVFSDGGPSAGNFVAARDRQKRRDDMKRYVRLMFLIGYLAASTQMVAADQPISITVRPEIAIAHGNARLKVLVERNDLNRRLMWEVDGPNYYRSSTLELEGASAPRSWFFLVRDLAEGDYIVRATVWRSDDSQLVARAQIRVISSMP